jgi:hypothetical protein
MSFDILNLQFLILIEALLYMLEKTQEKDSVGDNNSKQ